MHRHSTRGKALKRALAFSLLGLATTLTGAILPAPVRAEPPPQAQPKKPFPAVSLAKRMRGQEAVQALGDRLPDVAAWYGMTPQEFARMMREDRRAWLDRSGRLLYIDDFPPPPEGKIDAAAGTEAPAAAPVPLELTFQLHSRPGAARTIYLDFTGGTVANTAWNSSYGLAAIDAKPFDLDGSPTSFSTAELERIQYIWQRIAEDYAPFDVDVTTEEPLTADAITRSSSADAVFGTRVYITRDWTSLTTSPCNCGGIAYVGIFDDVGDFYKPAWVFFDRLGSGNEKYVAEAVSHEAGHNLGLSHDGYNDGSTSKGYYDGHGSGATGWAPIMGVGYYKELTQWSKGEYAYATQTQDDFLIIQNTGAPLRQDDHGGDFTSATPLTGTSAAGVVTLAASGLIGTRQDIDVFRFDAGAGSITVTVKPGTRGPNLDAMARLYDQNGTLLASANPTETLDAALTFSAGTPGSYFLAIDGTGKGSATNGYSDYGSVGEYSVTASVPEPFGSPPVAVASATPTSGTAPLAVAFSGAGSYDPDRGPVSWSWNFGDASPSSTAANPTHTYAAAGTYTATLTVTDSSGSIDVAQVQISASAAALALHVENIAMSLTVKRGLAKATARVTVLDGAGRPVSGATVSGTWSGVVAGPASGVTSASGVVDLSSPQTKKYGTFTFTVTAVSAAGATYVPGQNKETSDSIVR